MKIPREAASTAHRAFRTFLVGEALDEEKLREYVRELVASRHRNWRPVLHELKRLTRLHLDKRRVRVESGTKLAKAELKRIQATLAARYGEGLQYEFVLNPALLGGMRIRVGDDVWDGSVKGRLDRLAAAF